MQTNFTLAQLANPDIAAAEPILRACVHCGFCTATCPTYVLLGDELDSPRGRIYLIKDMLENDKPADKDTALHIDRCLSCLSCMTTCPSGVHYMHLVDVARAHVEETYERPPRERWMRAALRWLLPRPWLFGPALMLGRWMKPLLKRLPAPLDSWAEMIPSRRRQTAPASSARDLGQARMEAAQREGGAVRKRVALLGSCVQQAMAPEIDAATERLLARHGVELVAAPGSGCCGALAHHLGEEGEAKSRARRNIAAWERLIETGPLDAILVNASGCGTVVKDYGFMLRTDPAWKERAARVSALTRDITEFMAELGLDTAMPAPDYQPGLEVAYHSACSMQHGQRVKRPPVELLAAAGFAVKEPAEGHLCCGSAGTYNLLQPEIATQLGRRKAGHLAATGAAIVATGNIGCIAQIARHGTQPVVHTVELLDWATGGPKPAGLQP
ncbi:glycolate oxidase iron-sulfur subunit [Hypericibacter adhaerens]|uniref:Glycolate oxidase iron-sulfur subunit n=1 Tax=Hypericibacter adhaerens TaxID=2602016 RepID=A0A5J6N647_9PROT|nr:glycolate oxidase subunit GlcF [Hypericibacter adhaerens]QEX24090.1 glycolate oxidase iron-sulfur subunit [Hypericibacter adhaerens]